MFLANLFVETFLFYRSIQVCANNRICISAEIYLRLFTWDLIRMGLFGSMEFIHFVVSVCVFLFHFILEFSFVNAEFRFHFFRSCLFLVKLIK